MVQKYSLVGCADKRGMRDFFLCNLHGLRDFPLFHFLYSFRPQALSGPPSSRVESPETNESTSIMLNIQS